MNGDQRKERYELEERIRKNIAAELHDSIGQQLSTIKYFIEALMRSSDVPIGSNLEESLKDIVKMIQRTNDEVRRVALELRPKMLDDLGLLPTINWLLKEYQKVLPGVLINKRLIADDNTINDILKVTIFRILQESLNNIAKHSNATKVSVDLTQANSELCLEVKDNGVGFDNVYPINAENYNTGLGLGSIKTRAELSGGQAEIVSQKGDGVRVRVIWKNNYW